MRTIAVRRVAAAGSEATEFANGSREAERAVNQSKRRWWLGQTVVSLDPVVDGFTTGEGSRERHPLLSLLLANF